ncbi:long-chain fatty acid transporter [Algoriphagus halophytocola]|uniref:Long-chain fatty acid transporter n=1 Tax=Algoriphagus halophytocola TaxID=2991499 RepID=A0ABY6MKA4_9BACT|nr:MULTISPECIES: long-chain fatty acid transporter [unclassified Algoriphagus]UZD22706.1 long-chain fatty acid transporter [Algoriphagus sp. TR-M5]WBL43971.1 long-chain fatty acid transporter [Algoriphagus sp. TR-M9]
MRSPILVVTLVLVSISSSFAQSGYFEDAYRFSHVLQPGSARIMGVGGTQWSLGGDVSNVAGNPAGLGFFRSSEASITAGYTDWGVETDYLNQSKNYNTTNFSLPNLSFVMANPRSEFDRGSFKGGAFGISIQRIANFNTEYGYYADTPGGTSIIDFYLQDANGVPETQISSYGLTGLAYDTYQINPIVFDENGDPIANPNTYDSFVLGLPFQDENITQEGSSSQINFSYGANFNYKLFIGGSVGIRTLDFSSRKIYNEEFPEDPLISSSLQENLFISGSGINLNLGVIYKPIDYLNLGFTFQSPTWYALNDEYDAAIFTDYDNYYFEQEDVTLGQEDAFTDIILSSYNLNTPLKIGGGATVFLGKNGFLSADVDWLDYSTANLSSRDFDEGPDNMAIEQLYTSTINFRFGGEYRFNNFRIRGGYGFYGDPIANSDYDRSTQQISGGVGVKLNKFNIDFALVNQKFSTLYSSYQVLDGQGNNIGPVTEINNNLINGLLTVGFSF